MEAEAGTIVSSTLGLDRLEELEEIDAQPDLFSVSSIMGTLLAGIASAADSRRNDMCERRDCHSILTTPFVLEGTTVPGDDKLRKLVDEDSPGK